MSDRTTTEVFVCDEHGEVAARAGEPWGCYLCREETARLRMTSREIAKGVKHLLGLLADAHPLYRAALRGNPHRHVPLTPVQLRELLRIVWEHGADYGVAKQLEVGRAE